MPTNPTKAIVTAALVTCLSSLAASPAQAAPPSHDDFADAKVVTGSFTDSLSTAEATNELGEPDECPWDAGNSVWYALTTAGDGTAVIDTAGSSFDTVLEVYTGTFAAPVTVACNDDVDNTRQSRVSFAVTAATTYYVRAAAYGGGTGDLVIHGDVQVGMADVGVRIRGTGSLLGGTITTTVIAKNNGPAGASSIVATTQLPPGTTHVTGLPGGCTYASGAKQVSCTISSLPSGGQATRTFTVHIGLLTIGLPLPLQVTRTASSPIDPVPGNDTDSDTCTVLTGLIISC